MIERDALVDMIEALEWASDVISQIKEDIPSELDEYQVIKDASESINELIGMLEDRLGDTYEQERS